jgi:murein DD-endopeptidase MepM/ murein hydrolase activator NlpD
MRLNLTRAALLVISLGFLPGASKAETTAEVSFQWPTNNHTVTYGYKEVMQFQDSGFHWLHRGIDIAGETGDAVYASAAGTVKRAYCTNIAGFNGYGCFIVLKHDDQYKTVYAHLDTLAVKKGDAVVAGQTIGTVGSTGRSTGPHLHFEIREKAKLRFLPIDPLDHLPQE